VVQHHDDDAFRFEAPEQRAAVDRLGPGGVGLEEDVARGEGVEVEGNARLSANVGEAVGGADQVRTGEGKIASGIGVKDD